MAASPPKTTPEVVPKNLTGETLPSGQTAAQIQAQVQAQIDAQIAGQISPLQGLIDQYATQSGRAVSDLNTMFGGIQTDVEQSAERLGGQYTESIDNERAVHSAVSARLQQLQQERAADAQKLAQQIGGPVPLGMFTDPVALESSLQAANSGGSLLKAGMLRDSGMQQAEAFAGRVFPLMKAEKVQETKNFFRDKIKDLEREIATIKGQRKGLISEEYRKRLLEERGYALEKLQAQQAMYSDAQNRNIERQRIQSATYGQDLDATLTREGWVQSKDDKQALYSTTVKDNINAYIDALISGQAKTVDIYRIVTDADGSQRSVRETRDLGAPGTTDPQAIYNYIKGRVTGAKGMPKYVQQQIINQLKAKGIQVKKDWVWDPVEGQASGSPTSTTKQEQGLQTLPTYKQLTGMALPNLITTAKNLFGFKGGWPPVTKNSRGELDPAKQKQWLVNWMWQRIAADSVGNQGDR